MPQDSHIRIRSRDVHHEFHSQDTDEYKKVEEPNIIWAWAYRDMLLVGPW